MSSYSFPLKRDEFMLVTSPFGMRTDPMDSSKQQMHKGIDIQTKLDDVLATENQGKVVAVNQNAHTASGKSVTLEYQRENGDKCQISYLHLSSINVKIGDEVKAGQKIGISGNTGTRTTGEHLHFGVKQIADGTEHREILTRPLTWRKSDRKEYSVASLIEWNRSAGQIQGGYTQ